MMTIEFRMRDGNALAPCPQLKSADCLGIAAAVDTAPALRQAVPALCDSLTDTAIQMETRPGADALTLARAAGILQGAQMMRLLWEKLLDGTLAAELAKQEREASK